MSYRRLAPPQTAWAQHLDRVRQDRDWSATQLFEDAHEALGLGPKSLTSFKPVLVAKPMPDKWAPILADRYGAPEPEPAKEEPGPSLDVTGLLVAVTRALEATAQTLTDVRLELRDARREAAEQREATAELLGSLTRELRALAGTQGGSVAPDQGGRP